MNRLGKKYFFIILTLILVSAGSAAAYLVGGAFETASRNTSLTVPRRSPIIPTGEHAGPFSSGMEQQTTVDVKPGNWGGTGISFVVEKDRVVIQLDCANVNIPSRLKATKKGRFAATGLLQRNGPGPTRVGPASKLERVRVEGRSTGNQLQLTLTIVGTGETLGDFTLERDKGARLHRCL